MGAGDVKLAFLMGLVLGWPNILVALFLAFTLGAIVGLTLILVSREPFSVGERFSRNYSLNYSLKSQIPFAPFLIIGTFVALFWGERLIGWYGGGLF
jgi:prepilin signal peptidase PulO-like enzyme (type II secretory pathway)